jgi:hypothetical protein
MGPLGEKSTSSLRKYSKIWLPLKEFTLWTNESKGDEHTFNNTRWDENLTRERFIKPIDKDSYILWSSKQPYLGFDMIWGANNLLYHLGWILEKCHESVGCLLWALLTMLRLFTLLGVMWFHWVHPRELLLLLYGWNNVRCAQCVEKSYVWLPIRIKEWRCCWKPLLWVCVSWVQDTLVVGDVLIIIGGMLVVSRILS